MVVRPMQGLHQPCKLSGDHASQCYQQNLQTSMLAGALPDTGADKGKQRPARALLPLALPACSESGGRPDEPAAQPKLAPLQGSRRLPAGEWGANVAFTVDCRVPAMQ